MLANCFCSAAQGWLRYDGDMAMVSTKVKATGEFFLATAVVRDVIQHDAHLPIKDEQRYKGHLHVGSQVKDTEERIRFTDLTYTEFAGFELDEVPFEVGLVCSTIWASNECL